MDGITDSATATRYPQRAAGAAGYHAPRRKVPARFHAVTRRAAAVCVDQKSNSVTWLDLDPATGLPHPPSGALGSPTPTCVLFG
jgi:6-phosphogluconolactonase (cycloisomerase 2 family)